MPSLVESSGGDSVFHADDEPSDELEALILGRPGENVYQRIKREAREINYSSCS